jgi:WD40 repeat protein
MVDKRKSKKRKRKAAASTLPVYAWALAGAGGLVMVVLAVIAIWLLTRRPGQDGEADPKKGEVAERGETAYPLRFRGPLKEATTPCNAIAFSADGRLMALALRSNAVKVWDVQSGAERATLAPHVQNPNRVAFHPNGRWLYASDFGGGLYQWDIATGHLLRSDKPFMEVFGMEVSPDGAYLALAARAVLGRPALHRYRCATFEQLPVVYGATGKENVDIVRVAFSPDGKSLATGQLDGQVALRSPADGSVQATLDWPRPSAAAKGASPFFSEGVTGLRFSPDGRLLAASRKYGAVRAWKVADRSVAGDFDAGADPQKRFNSSILSLAFSPNGSILAAGDGEGFLLLWTVADRRQVARESYVKAKKVRGVTPLAELVFRPDGKRLISLAGLVAFGCDVGAWDTDVGGAGDPGRSAVPVPAVEPVAVASVPRSLRPRLRFPAGGPTPAYVFRHDSKQLATMTNNVESRTLSVAFWDPTAGGRVGGLDIGKRDYAAPAVLRPDFRVLVVPTNTGLDVWDVEKKERMFVIPSPAPVDAGRITFAPDGRSLAHRSNAGLDLWDLEKKEVVTSIRSDDMPFVACAFAPDGRTVAVARQKRPKEPRTPRPLSATLHDRATGKTLATADLWRGSIDFFAFVDAHTLLMGTHRPFFDRQMRLYVWDTRRPKPETPFSRDSFHIIASADGKRACELGSGTLYDLAGLRVCGVVRSIRIGRGSLEGVFRSDGHLLAADRAGIVFGLFRGTDGTLVGWLTRPAKANLASPVFSPDCRFVASAEGVWEVSPEALR